MTKHSVIRSAGIVMLSTLISRVLGFIRDMIVAGYFGASASLDGFFVAFRIPNLLRRLVAEGALTISFIPVYTEYQVKHGEEEALKLAQKTLSMLIVALVLLVGLGMFFSPQVVRLFAWGFTDADVIRLTVSLNRVMFPYLASVGLVAFAMGVLNSHGFFFAPAFSPVLLNVGFITGAVVLSKLFAEPLYGLAWGVILGGTLQVLLQVPYMVKSGFRMRFSLDFSHPGIRSIFRMLGPALFGIAIYQINIFMSTLLASMLPSGSISYLYYADRITEIVLGIFIVSIGNVMLPEMSRFSAMEDTKALSAMYSRSMNAALFMAVPAAVALMTVGLPIVSVLYMRGQFTGVDAGMTNLALLYASMGIASVAILRITTPTFYSLKDTRTPVISSAVSFVLNITLGYLLMRTSLRHAGLSLANSIASTVQVLILLVFLNRRIGFAGMRSFFLPLAKVCGSSAVMAVAIWLIARNVDWLSAPFGERMVRLMAIVLSGIAVYAAACAVFGVGEIRFLRDRLKGRLLR